MSSYFSVYIVPKRKSEKEEKKHILILSYSRSSDIYQYFDENIHPAFVGMEDTRYTILDKENLGVVLSDIGKDIDRAKSRLELYEKYASSNAEYIEEIMSQKEYLEDLEYCKTQISVIEDIVDNAEFYDDIEEVSCNIG